MQGYVKASHQIWIDASVLCSLCSDCISQGYAALPFRGGEPIRTEDYKGDSSDEV